jgi:polyhydroxybutyrate depolymerase
MKIFPGFWRALSGWVVLATAVLGADDLVRRQWTVDGVAREGLIHVPRTATAQPAPLVFAFHGHGGTMRSSARSQPVHELWPEALVVYLQGLPTPGRLTDPEGKKNGWQHGGGAMGDRDLKFFDVVFADLQREYKVDKDRVYSTGHSNGGGFTYLLWAKRGNLFAAFGPSAAVALPEQGRLTPHPAIHVAGENDPLVKFAWQQRMIESLKETNQCETGEPAGKYGTLYPSKVGAPLMTYIHPGTHQYPKEATAVIVEFFKKHPRRKS